MINFSWEKCNLRLILRCILQYKTSLHEEYLSIIIYVVCERYYEGIGQVQYEERAQREIIHVLASGPKPHSKIQKAITGQVIG